MQKTKHILFINKHLVAIIFLFIIGTVLRFYNLNWDLGQYLHPDERLYINAANLALPHSVAEFFSPSSPLNPHMFYYGSFPLYLYKVVASGIFKTFDLLVVSRMISALFSSLTIIMVYLLAKQFFSEKIALVAALVFAFSPGSIQYAHFNTTESLLLFLLTVSAYLSSKLYFQNKPWLLLPLGIILGISFATKIVGLTFGIFPLIAGTLLFIHEKKQRGRLVLFFVLCLILAGILGFLLSPYQLIDWTNFTKEQSYMQAVTYGKYKPPFVLIYEHTLPYLYPLMNVLPFTFGLVSLCSSILGIFLFIKQKHRLASMLLLLLFPGLYFLWAGAWFAKFARYYLLIIPFLSIFAAVFLLKIKPLFRGMLLFFIVLQGVCFSTIYLTPNTRVAATYWIRQQIPPHAIIATEHWDDSLPLSLYGVSPYTNMSLPVYDSESEQKIQQLSQMVANSDYIILSSRRVYASILNNTVVYPQTTHFYEQLFAGNLGYTVVKTFTNYPYGFSDDVADESFQSYDHPPVTIFKNEKRLSPEMINMLIHHE